MLAQPAAGSVLEMGGTVHRLNYCCFFLGKKVVVFAVVLFRLRLAADNRLCSGSNGPVSGSGIPEGCA